MDYWLMIDTTFMTSAQGQVCIKLKFAYTCKLICLEVPAEEVFFYRFSFFSEMRVLADEEIFKIVNSTAVNISFFDTEINPVC